MSKRLAIITTHPIQYYAPVFKLLAQQLSIRVFYTAGADFGTRMDKGFGKKITWDIPLLDGYEYQFLTNIATDKGTHHFKGIINTDAITAINAYAPDTLLIFGWANHSHLKIMRHFKGMIPIYFRGDSTLLDQQKTLKNVLRTIFLTWVYKNIDKAFYTGKANKKYYLKYGVAEKNLIFAPHAIDIHRFAEDRSEEVSIFRESLNLKQSDLLLLFAGKLESKKNPALLLKAFEQLNLDHAHLLFVGNGLLESDLKHTVKNEISSDLVERIHFIDFQNQSMMPVVYQAADLFCLTSKGPGETWGLAVNEAMASGKAILVSNKVGCAEDLVTEDCGRIFKSEDLEDLKQNLVALTASKTLLEALGRNAKESIQHWSFEEQVKIIVNNVIR
jgi:glycosyltransferase involved in cell wall biosynthesis